MHTNTPTGAGPVDQLVRPRAWLCELEQEDGTTSTQLLEQDPDGLRWNDAGKTSPYRTTPLYQISPDLVAYLLRHLCRERAAIAGFLQLGNEVSRAKRLDAWIAAVSGPNAKHTPDHVPDQFDQ